jgi:ABC-2 type transport system ATP-binding protein
MSKDVLIKFSKISKSFGKNIILNNVNLEINEGDIFAIIGPSGSGKSTLMKILLGSYTPDSGNVFFKNNDITGQSNRLKKIVGLTTQDNSFYEDLTIYENMRYYANLYDMDIFKENLKDHIFSILKSVKLFDSKDKLSKNISGGMKRRLDFAISLIHDPELLILDEPTTGLDPILVNEFWEIIRSINKQGKTILVISHIFPEIKQNCNRACILNKGFIKTFDITTNIDLFKKFEQEIVNIGKKTEVKK